MPRQSRDFLARKLRQNWLSKFPDNNRATTAATTTGVKEVDDSLTNLNWLQNMNLMKMTSPAPPLSPPPDSLAMRRSMSYDPSLLNTQFPETIDQIDDADMLEYRTNPLAKPHLSYASLICMAMKDLNKTKVALTDIYEWVMDNFIYYRIAEPSWQNSIRHNLSLNKCFQKVPRRKDEPGKGGFWRFNPDYQRVLDAVPPPTVGGGGGGGGGKKRRNAASTLQDQTASSFHHPHQQHHHAPVVKRQRSMRVGAEMTSYQQYEYNSYHQQQQQTQHHNSNSLLPAVNSTSQHHQTSTPLPMMSAAFHHQLHPNLHHHSQHHQYSQGYHNPSQQHHMLAAPTPSHSFHQDDLVNAMMSPGLPTLTRGAHTQQHHNSTSNSGSQEDVATAVLNDYLSSGGGMSSCEDPRYPPMDLTTQGDPLDLTIQGVSLKPPEWWSQSLGSSTGAQLMAAARLDLSQGLGGSRTSMAPSPLLLEEDQQWVDEQLNLEELDTILGLS